MAPVIVRKHFTWLAFPLDFGFTMNGRPVLGKNKTFRGLVFGIIFALVVAFIQYLLGEAWGLAVLDYSEWVWIGILMGTGAILGDACESFVKRRLGLRPGRPFIPFDQIDFSIGAIVFLSILQPIGFSLALTAIIGSAFLHIISNHVAFYFGIRNEKW